MLRHKLSGVGAAMITPFTADSRVYWNKPEGYTYQRDRTWQFNNLKPRTYK